MRLQFAPLTYAKKWLVMKRKNQNYMTPNEVAELLMVTPAAVRIWAEKGDIDAQTTPGGHRRFLRTEVARFAESRGLNLFNPQNDSNKVLIIEDDEFFAQYLAKMLKKLNNSIEVEIVNDSFKAGIKVKEYEPSIILLDLVMPGIDGFEICKVLKESNETKSIRILAMTSHTDPEVIQRILSAGAETCLQKPIDAEQLKSAIKLPNTSSDSTQNI